MFTVIRYDHDELIHRAFGQFDTKLEAELWLQQLEPLIEKKYPACRVEGDPRNGFVVENPAIREIICEYVVVEIETDSQNFA